MSAHRLVFGEARLDGTDARAATASTTRRRTWMWRTSLVAVLMIAIAAAYRLL